MTTQVENPFIWFVGGAHLLTHHYGLASSRLAKTIRV